jgi:segregation and condensation protein B
MSSIELQFRRKMPIMTESELQGALEAILMVVEEPVSTGILAQITEVPIEEIEANLNRMRQEYQERGHGFELRNVAGGWRFYSSSSQAAYVERFVVDGQPAHLSQAALETLAVIAYRQPVSRARISAIRGVNVEAVMKTLVTRGLVEESGVEYETGSTLYSTTNYFLQRLGLNSVSELPALAPFLPDLEALDEVIATLTE